MYIEELVRKITKDIESVDQLNIDYISEKFNILVIYHPQLNLCVKVGGRLIVYIKYDTPFKMWQNFCHELGHCIMHETNQLEVPDEFNKKQEAEAELFAMLFMVPERLILKYDIGSYKEISERFKVPYCLAYKRLEHLRNSYYIRFQSGFGVV